mmetsp:Transcript_45488/g.134638  ORF Transcript_45488/g.134638 Transcript_45488/m.134638 type:complete len:246 (-) Transcript_45488:19-756(-)
MSPPQGQHERGSQQPLADDAEHHPRAGGCREQRRVERLPCGQRLAMRGLPEPGHVEVRREHRHVSRGDEDEDQRQRRERRGGLAGAPSDAEEGGDRETPATQQPRQQRLSSHCRHEAAEGHQACHRKASVLPQDRQERRVVLARPQELMQQRGQGQVLGAVPQEVHKHRQGRVHPEAMHQVDGAEEAHGSAHDLSRAWHDGQRCLASHRRGRLHRCRRLLLGKGHRGRGGPCPGAAPPPLPPLGP